MGRPSDNGRPNDKEFPASGGWTEVNRRARKTSTRWDNDMETTFFIENLPEEATNNMLWKLYGKVGRLSDAYIAKKKDTAGNRFGFLRFWNVRDIDGILDEANRIRVNEAVVKVSLARFDRNHRKFTHTTVEPPKKQVMFKQVTPRVVRGDNFDAGRRFVPGGVSYKEVVKNQGVPRPVNKTVKISGEEGILQRHWIGKAVIGEGKSIESLEAVRKVMEEMGLIDAGLMYVGGMKMLVTFHDKGQALDFINNGRLKWGEVFESARLWNGEDMAKERVVKLNIAGLPIQLRDDESFNEIGKAFGRVVGLSEFSWSSMDASVGSCVVVINHWDKIDEVINVEWKHRRLEVKVVEEVWKPAFVIPAGLEEGEFRQPSPEKLESGFGSSKDSGRDKKEGEKSASLHGEGCNFNAGGVCAQEFNFEGGGEDFVMGVDPIRKKKRRRVGLTVDSSPDKNKEVGQEHTGPMERGNGSVGIEQTHQAGPFVFKTKNNVDSRRQENTRNGEGEKENENTVGGSDAVNGGADGDITMESVDGLEHSQSEVVEAEVINTLRTGEALGVRIEAFKKDVEELVVGDGVFEGTQ